MPSRPSTPRPTPASSATGRIITVRGIVQGVGFRPWVLRTARGLGLVGEVLNDDSGARIEVCGPPASLDALCAQLRSHAPSPVMVVSVAWRAASPRDFAEFSIAASSGDGACRPSLAPDLATCPDCLAELAQPGGRRLAYAFTSCTACGPRATIAQALPFDRQATTMAGFGLCPACQAEYDDVGDRRLHAQTLACPACGPRLQWQDPLGQPRAVADPLRCAVEALRAGAIVAIKGLGGFHLACDATSTDSVAALRQRKRRTSKPFAVMVADLEAARRIAVISDAEAEALCAVQRPVVLARAVPGVLAAQVAPDSARCGVFLPGSPLQHLLLRGVGRPLVMTSANASDEPMAITNDDAVARLGGIADHALLHDRDIALRCDDSVLRVVAGAPSLLRRGRGWTWLPLPVPVPFREPILAVGGQQKNSICLGVGGEAWLSPHIGDLDDPQTLAEFQHMIEHMQRLIGVVPRIVAHDLHPDYASTRFALERPESRCVAVHHHHAHAASAMAEHGLLGPVLAVVYDGTGLGSDGAAWGGEILRCTLRDFERLATLRPLLLAGGEAAIRQPWRVALALVCDAMGPQARLDDLPVFAAQDPAVIARVRQMLSQQIHTVPAHGGGRYFDAVAALLIGRGCADFEGQLSMAMEDLADPGPWPAFAFAIDRTRLPWQIDLRPMTRELLSELRAGVALSVLASRFHETLVVATAEVVQALRRAYHTPQVVLSGGCMLNARLAEGLAARLSPGGEVWLQRQVPAGDGGLALGQAVVAAARGAP